MRDPHEGRSNSGTIRTGADVSRLAPAFDDVLDAAVADVIDAAPRCSLYVYGSVATGQARAGRSDVDLVTIGLERGRAAELSTELSARFRGRCRGVEIAAASAGDLAGDGDEAYGFRVFLRHYCVHLAGRDHRPLVDFPADTRAARGFNGDIGRHLERWRSEVSDNAPVGATAVRIARKTLLAVAGLVSVHDRTWTTDRTFAAQRWSEIDPMLAAGIATLVEWVDRPPIASRSELLAVLETVVAPVVDRWNATIGPWRGGRGG